MNLDTAHVATVVLLVIALAGAVVVVVHPATLNFEDYIKGIGVAFGLLAIGRGLNNGTPKV